MIESHHVLEQFLRESAQVSDAGVQLSVQPSLNYVNVRVSSEDKESLDSIAGVLGQALPLDANRSSRGDHRVFWLGPDEWLVVTEMDATELVGRLRKNLDGRFATFVDISDGQICMTLSGPHSRDLLAKGCTLDLHPGEFHPGDCAQTTIAKASMLISLPGDGSYFEIYVRRSFAEYVALWLRHAGGEFAISAAAE